MRLLLWGLGVWTMLGLAGTVVSVRRGERARVRRGLLTLVAAWAVYLAALLLASGTQPVKVLAPGQDRCFGTMCFAVVGAEELQGFRVRGQERERLVRVAIRVTNRDKTGADDEPDLRGTLLDAQGRQWVEVPGLSGVRLTGRVAAGGTTVSEPVFRIAKDATGLGLVLTHGRGYSGRLVIGDAESLLHRPAVLGLPTP